jgi:hypothetical protein
MSAFQIVTECRAMFTANAYTLSEKKQVLVGARIKALQGMAFKFSNQRQWRDIVSAVQCSVNYPAVLVALRAGIDLNR